MRELFSDELFLACAFLSILVGLGLASVLQAYRASRPQSVAALLQSLRKLRDALPYQHQFSQVEFQKPLRKDLVRAARLLKAGPFLSIAKRAIKLERKSRLQPYSSLEQMAGSQEAILREVDELLVDVETAFHTSETAPFGFGWLGDSRRGGA